MRAMTLKKVAKVAAGIALAALIAVPRAAALRVQDIARLDGYGETTLWGLGLVTGLAGTGDGNETLPLARQVAAMMAAAGNPVPVLEELGDGQNIAMVQVMVKIPKEGARPGDQFDAHVTAIHAAESLQGGRLFITPLKGPLPGQGVYGYASGAVVLDGPTLTSGKVVLGAQMAAPIQMQVIRPDGSVVLDLLPGYRNLPNAQMLANMINQDRAGLDQSGAMVARALGAARIHVIIPEAELANPANFLGNMLSMHLDETLLQNPARIVIDRESGTIALSGDVTISPTVLSHRDLVITIVEPAPPPPTPDNPRLTRSEWAKLTTSDNAIAGAMLADLIEALEQLDVPPQERAEIIIRLAQAKLIHGELVLE